MSCYALAVHEYLASFHLHDSAGIQYVNTLCVKADPSGTDLVEPEANDVAAKIWTWLGAEYKACLNPAYTVDRVEALGILGHDALGVYNVGQAGTLAVITSDPLPRECAAVLSLRTSHVGRSGRGRMYIPSPRLAAYVSVSSTWNTGGGFWPALGGLGDQLLEGYTHWATVDVQGYHLSARVFSRADGLTRDVVSYVVRSDVRWLRSRAR